MSLTPSIGARLGRYELLERLGAGGMGEVFLARDHDLGRNVAIKFLPERVALDPDRVARFTAEARAASSLNHPNIVTIHEVGHAEGSPFLVMEYVDGQTLRQLADGTPMEADRILDVGVQLADGLAKAHAAGIVHRDLKPENLMITRDGFVKILDFGVAKLLVPEAAERVAGDDVTRTGAASTAPTSPTVGPLVGTPGYMSPEQVAGRSVDFRADQFAVGAVLYELAAGHRAFRRDTPVQTLAATIETQPEPLGVANPSVPPPLRSLIERCLAKDPDHRFASTGDLAARLRELREGSAWRPEVAAVRRRRLGRWALRLVVGAAAVLGGLSAVPSVREGILGPLQWLPLPAEKRIAVLPFRLVGGSDEDRLLCDGLLPYVTARLGQLERFRREAWIVPAVEVRQAGVASAETAGRALGATLVVDGTLQQLDGRWVLSLSLIEAARLRQLRAATVTVPPGQSSLLDQAVQAIVDMLDLELATDAKAALRAGGTGVVEASTAYAQALGFAPYEQARTALERYEQQQNLERAISLLNEALHRDPGYALAHAGLGEAYWRLSRFTRNAEHVALAEEHSRRALSVDATLAEAWLTLGMVRAGTGRAEEALADLQRAIDREPRSAAAHRELASAYRRLNRESEAEETYRRAIGLDPASWITRSYFAAYLASRGRPAEAEAQYTRALGTVPDNARVWSGLGAAYYLQEKYVEAEAAWQRSMVLHPTSTAAANLALRPFFLGEYDEAARRLERAVALDGRDYRVWRNLAAAYYWSSTDRERAPDAYRKAAELAERERTLNPADPGLLADLADCYAMLGEPAKARALARDAARLGGGQAQIARTLAGIHEHLGNRDVALRWVAAAVGLGVPADEIERDPSLAQLRTDRRFQRLKSSQSAQP